MSRLPSARTRELTFVVTVFFSGRWLFAGGDDNVGESRQDARPQQRQQQQPEKTSFEERPSGNQSLRTEERSAELSGARRDAAATDEFADIDAVLGGTFVSGAEDGGSAAVTPAGGDVNQVSPGVGEDGVDSDSSSSSSGGGGGNSGGGGGGGGVDVAATKAELGSLKVPELKDRCRALGLKVGGKKAELQERILAALE